MEVWAAEGRCLACKLLHLVELGTEGANSTRERGIEQLSLAYFFRDGGTQLRYITLRCSRVRFSSRLVAGRESPPGLV